jgi:5,10-methylenetetrahydromethanopterin reductase
MRFGLGFLGDTNLRETLSWARELDRSERLDRIWVADERFLRDPWVQLGALAAVTERVSIGICVTDPYIRHPALTAAAAATLQELSGGRAILGLGAGSTGFAALGMEPRLPAQAVSECVDLCRRLWTESEPFSFEGRIVRLSDACLDFKPAQTIPIYVAARAPKMMAAAARKGDTVLIGSFVGGPGLDYALRTIDGALPERDASLGSLRRAAWVYFAVDSDAERARRAATRGIALALRSSLTTLVDIGYAIPADLVDFIRNSRHTLTEDQVDWVVSRLPESMIEDLTLAGDVPGCVSRLKELEERGVEEVVMLPFAPTGADLRDMIGTLLSEVAPATA